MKKKKGKGIPAPSPKLNSAYLRMDRSRGEKAGTSIKQSRAIGSNNFIMFQHQMDQLNANQGALSRGRGKK